MTTLTVKLIRKRERLLPNLERLAKHPGTTIDPARRAGFARKWARRIA